MRARRLLVPLACLACVAADWPPPDMPTPEQFKLLQAQARGAHVKPSPQAPPPVFRASLPKALSEAESKAALARFQNAFFVGGKAFGKQMIEADVFLLPNPDTTTARVSWKSAVDETGRSLLGAQTEPAELDMRSARVELPLANPDDSAAVVKATGRMTVEAPAGFDELTVSCADVGKAAQLGPLRVTMETCETDVFVALADGLGELDEVVPLDADKRALAPAGTTRFTLFSGKRFEELTYDEFKKGPGTQVRVEMRAKGAVAFVRILRPKGMKKVELDVVATPEASFESYGPASRVRYLEPPAPLPPFAVLDEAGLSLTLASSRSCAMMGYNAPGIELVLPTVGNSLLVRAELARPKVTGAPRSGFELEENGLDEQRLRYRWTLRGKGDAPLAFKSLAASATVKYPLSVVKRALSAGEGGVRIEGHRVTIPLAEELELAEGAFGKVQGIVGFDATGGALKPFSLREADGDGVHVAFMGKVARVEVTTVSKWMDRAVTAQLQPAPLRPADRAGLCD